MAMPSIIVQEANIVLVGSFNPAIFHPEWFVRHSLVPSDDLKGVKLEIVHPDLSKFSFKWLSIDVLREKFIARTNDPASYSPLRDLVVSTFNILDHTVLNQLGMNLMLVYDIEEESAWHKIGDVLAPKEIWKKTLPDRIGLKTLTIQSPRQDTLNGHIKVSIGPSNASTYSVRVDVNNHVELLDKDRNVQYKVSEIIAENWEKSIEFAKNVCDSIITGALENE